MPPPPNRRTQGYWLWLGVILLAGIALRWWNLRGESLWFDEAYTAWAAEQPAGRLIEVVRVDNSPPLYYLLMRGWTSLFGNSEGSLRAPSAIAGTICLGLVACLARRWFDHPPAELLAVALMAGGWLGVRYAHEARTYALLALLGLCAFAATERWVRTGRPAWLVATIACLSAMTWMHNMAWLFVASAALAMCVWPGGGSIARRLIRAGAPTLCVVLLYLPWLSTLWRQVGRMSGGFWIPRPDLESLYYMLVLILGVKLTPMAGWFRDLFGRLQPALLMVQLLIAAAMIAAAGATVPAKGDDRAARRRLLPLAIVTLGPLVLAFVASLIGTSVFTPKAFTPSAAVAPLLLAGVVASSTGPWRTFATVAVATIAGLSVLGSTGQLRYERKEDWRGVYGYLALRARDSTLLVFAGNDGQLGLDYYESRLGRLPGRRTGVPHGFHDASVPRAMQRVTDDAALDAVRREIISQPPEVIVLIGTHLAWSDPSGLTLGYLTREFQIVEQHDLDGVLIRVFRPHH